MRKIIFIIISILIVFLLAIAVYSIYAPNPEKQKTVAENAENSVAVTSLKETTPETTSIETLSTSGEATAAETTQTTYEDINKNLPTLKLVIYEGPVVIEDNSICYYRVEAIVTGDPYPSIKFSKDDSNGAWGNNKTQINLKNGESYDLVVTATNSAGNITKSINLTWIQ